MRRVLALIVTAVLLGVGFGQGTEATIKTKCAADWPGDFAMQAYCEKNQRQAVGELQRLNATHGGIPEAAYKTALGGCVRDWPGDYEMQAYCVRNQIDGYQTVAQGPSSPLAVLTQQETATINRHCASEWPGDFEMQAYCERQQADGAAFLKTHPDSHAVQACAMQWPEDYEMQAYCVQEGLY